MLCYYISQDQLLMKFSRPFQTQVKQKIDKAVEALNTYFIPQVNTAYEEYNFRQTKQRDNETLGTYHTRLRHLSQNCYIFTLTHNTSNKSQPPQCEVLISTQPISVIIDSGASVNIIDEPTYKLLTRKNSVLRLRQPESNIFSYGSNYQSLV